MKTKPPLYNKSSRAERKKKKEIEAETWTVHRYHVETYFVDAKNEKEAFQALEKIRNRDGFCPIISTGSRVRKGRHIMNIP